MDLFEFPFGIPSHLESQNLFLRGEGEMHGKSNMETYITICKINSQREFAVWLRKLKQGLCINLEGCDGKGDGRELQKVGIYVYLWLIPMEV